MRQRRETAEHPFATLKMSMGATQFLIAYGELKEGRKGVTDYVAPAKEAWVCS
jgi:hypothetical protein